MAEFPVSNRSGHQVSLSDARINSLRSTLTGGLLAAGSNGYDEARTVWNGMLDQQPGLIVRALSTADVVAAVDFARSNELLVSVRSGGHNIAGKSVTTNSFNIDLSAKFLVRSE